MPTTSEISGQAGDVADKAQARIESISESTHKAIDRVADKASSVTQQLGEKSSEFLAAQRRWTAKSCNAVCRHPLASVAIAVAAGALISRLSGRSSLSERP